MVFKIYYKKYFLKILKGTWQKNLCSTVTISKNKNFANSISTQLNEKNNYWAKISDMYLHEQQGDVKYYAYWKYQEETVISNSLLEQCISLMLKKVMYYSFIVYKYVQKFNLKL